MVELRDRRIVIDGEPRLVFAGEVHYFRLAKSEWKDRLEKAAAVGCNAIASYIPWLVHEPKEGEFVGLDDVAEFIDLCHEGGLWFIARPGPFVMAEMKNEGIPYWVYERYPEAIPIGWKGAKATTATLDYLHEGYLSACDRWYAAIMPVLAKRLHGRGGTIIAVQLDNEVGMLNWVSNGPILTDDALCDFARWATAHGREKRYPFDLGDPAPRNAALRDPKADYAPALHTDLGDWERDYIARYIAHLRASAERQGVRDVLWLVNIHGTGGGRGLPFPIGIHQLFQSYTQAPGYLAGSDHYLGELTRENAPDLYVINAFMDAVNRPEQPLASFEFEVGTGDYGETGAVRQSGASADMKVRLSLAQGNRLLNYYLLAGGRNPKLKYPVGDGNDRVAFTGERHGFAAPINPEGELDVTYGDLQMTMFAVKAVADKLADMDEEHDAISLGFLPDYYKTDYKQTEAMERIVQGLEWTRGPLEVLSRAMLFASLRFTAVDLQRRPITTPALALSVSRYLDEAVQRKLAEYVRGGGKLLLVGDFPTMDMEARPCTVLADALGIRVKESIESSSKYHLSTKGEEWAAFEPEVRVWRTVTFEEGPFTTYLRTVEGAPTGIEVNAASGRAIMMPNNYPCHMRLFREAFSRLGVRPGIVCEPLQEGVLITSMRNRAGERFLNVINLDHEEKRFRLTVDGVSFGNEAEIYLEPRSARLLPLGVVFGDLEILDASADLIRIYDGLVDFQSAPYRRFARIRASRPLRVMGARFEQKGDITELAIDPGQSAQVMRR